MTREELNEKWSNVWDTKLTQAIIEGAGMNVDHEVREACLTYYGSMENLLDRVYELRKMYYLMDLGPINAERALVCLYEGEVKG